MSGNERCPECEEMQKSHKDYCIWCSNYEGVQVCESCSKVTNEEICAECMKRKKEIADAFEKAERNMNNGVKIPVISMEDVPKLAKEMGK